MLLQSGVTAAIPIWAWLAILLAGAFVGAWIAQRVIIRMLRRLTQRTHTSVDDVVLRAIAPALTLAFFVGGMWIGLQYAPIAFSPGTRRFVDNIAITLILVAAAIAVARLLGGFLALPAQREPRWQPLSAVGTRVVYVAIYSIALMMILARYGLEVGPLIASLGIAAIAVALALQDTLANFLAGIWLQAGRTLQRGHLVELEDPKVSGFVSEVGWRTTKIHTLPNNIVVIPNKTVAEATITDYNLPEPRMGTNMIVRAAYEADPEQVEKILLDSVRAVARDEPESGILDDPPPSTRLNGFGDFGYEFWLGFHCRDWFSQWNGAGAIRKEIVRRFREAGIRMPYPMREQFAVPSNRGDLVDAVTAGSYGNEGAAGARSTTTQGEGSETTGQPGG